MVYTRRNALEFIVQQKQKIPGYERMEKYIAGEAKL